MRYTITGRESGRRMRSSLIRNRCNSDWYAYRGLLVEKKTSGDGVILTYLEILLQPGNNFLLVAGFLASQVRAGGRIGKVARLEYLQE